MPPEGGSGPIVAPQPNRWFGLRRAVVMGILAVVIAGAALVVVTLVRGSPFTSTKEAVTSTQSASEQPRSATEDTVVDSGLLTLDPTKNYGDKYADGLLPVGDGKYMTTAAKKGFVYICNANFVPASQAGAQTRGPWFVNSNTQWDITKKVAVQGAVRWSQNITIEIKDGKRVVTTNDLPDHTTGVFPVGQADPARTYDANPNAISAQNLVYSLAANPTAGDPSCMGGEVGVMTTGVALFNAFDAGGRDAGAWEVQDSCDGHPQSAGEYHYHTLSRCIKDVSVTKIIGYALDGFPITGPKVGDKNYLTTDDLDECHGIVSEIVDGDKKVTTYHYVMTQDFPYSVSCFRASAVQPPGQQEQAGSNQQPSGGQSKPAGKQLPPPPKQ